MLQWLTLVLSCQWLGELLRLVSGLPVPGPVLGMLLLFGFLLVRGDVPVGLGQLGDGLLRHLSLLFVPAGVGVMAHADLLQANWVPITAVVLFSTLLTIGFTAWLVQRLHRPGNRP